MTYVAALILLGMIVTFVVTGPLRNGPGVDRREDERRATLEAAKEAKYREIRDAELDFRMGKLAEHDYRLTDRELREQAILILNEIDELEPEASAERA